MPSQYYFVFASKSQAIYMESQFRKNGLNLELKPTPSKLGKSCSYSLVSHGEVADIKRIRDQILSSKMSLKGVFQAVKTGQHTNFKKVF
ncbi:MAG: hypothetical protein HPY66_3288 [Firmicutes bacterium]|nr:hypothetical protein [Bacillota bacterium]MDI6705293.1 DUF3343 domain-containing protein [Bacillota bacterium]